MSYAHFSDLWLDYYLTQKEFQKCRKELHEKFLKDGDHELYFEKYGEFLMGLMEELKEVENLYKKASLDYDNLKAEYY